MKKFLTKAQSCEVLQRLNEGNQLSKEDAVKLASIRVCLAAEEMKLNLWGTSVEDARPIFRECEEPCEDSDECIFANYQAYKMCLAETCEKLTLKKENENG